jgi:hypothetical protein
MKHEIQLLIEKYAEVYQEFEKFQTAENQILPGGDQKTGVIAEYYAKCYIDSTFKVEAKYAKSGESYDLLFKHNGNEVKVQVKGVSQFSKTRTIAPLNLTDNSFDYLYLIELDKQFKPIAFYINSFGELKERSDQKFKIVGSKMKDSSKKGNSGSVLYNFQENQVEKMLICV